MLHSTFGHQCRFLCSPWPVLTGALCPIPGHEQDYQHKALPYRQSLPPWQPSHDPWSLPRVLSMRESSLSTHSSCCKKRFNGSLTEPFHCYLKFIWVCVSGFRHRRAVWRHDTRCRVSEDCPWNPQWTGPGWLPHQGLSFTHLLFQMRQAVGVICVSMLSISRSTTDASSTGCLLCVVFQMTSSAPSVQQ